MIQSQEHSHNEIHDPLATNDIQPIQHDDDASNVELAAVVEKTPAEIEYEQRQLEKERDKKRRQKRRTFAGYIRSRKFKRRLKTKVEQHVLNPVSAPPNDHCTTIPKAEMPYKKYRNDILEIMSQNEILVSRTRVNRRTSQPFNYNVISSQPQFGPKKKLSLKTEPSSTSDEHGILGHATQNIRSMTSQEQAQRQQPMSPALDTSPSIRPRPRRRINYSEDLVDQAFMYEQILHDKQKSPEKRKKGIANVAQHTSPAKNDTIDSARSAVPSPANLDSRLRLLEQRNEISIMPVKSRMMTKDNANKFDAKSIPMPMKVEPLFNITSSVSVFKPRKSDPSPSGLQISNITSLHSNRAGPSSKRPKIACAHCTKAFADEHQLAVHNIEHIQVSVNKLDAIRVLNPKLRRVSVVY